MNQVLLSSESTHWSTPLDFFMSWNNKYNFTLDVCADTTNYKVKKYFNEKTNGLMQDWSGQICWCNPPYKNIKDWVKKCYDEAENGTVVVLLMPARTDTKYFHQYIYHNPRAKITFLEGRLKFSNSKNAAPFPSMIVEFNSK